MSALWKQLNQINNMYWTEPKLLQDKKTWIVEKFVDYEKVGDSSFKSKQDAWNFLRTINIYINGKLKYSGL
jgi:hypothetical protein